MQDCRMHDICCAQRWPEDEPQCCCVLQEDGKWLLDSPLTPMAKPGGHGAIWKLMLDHGVFDWLAGIGRKGAIVRQISNPIAGEGC